MMKCRIPYIPRVARYMQDEKVQRTYKPHTWLCHLLLPPSLSPSSVNTSSRSSTLETDQCSITGAAANSPGSRPREPHTLPGRPPHTNEKPQVSRPHTPLVHILAKKRKKKKFIHTWRTLVQTTSRTSPPSNTPEKLRGCPDTIAPPKDRCACSVCSQNGISLCHFALKLTGGGVWHANTQGPLIDDDYQC